VCGAGWRFIHTSRPSRKRETKLAGNIFYCFFLLTFTKNVSILLSRQTRHCRQDIYKLTLCSSVDMSDIYGWHNPPLFTMRNSVRRSHNSQVCGLHRSESYDAGENYLWGQTLFFRECRIDSAKNCSETAPGKERKKLVVGFGGGG
jgi:hypothetical protein